MTPVHLPPSCALCSAPFSDYEHTEQRHIPNGHGGYRLAELCMPCYCTHFCDCCAEFVTEEEERHLVEKQGHTVVVCSHCYKNNKDWYKEKGYTSCSKQKVQDEK